MPNQQQANSPLASTTSQTTDSHTASSNCSHTVYAASVIKNTHNPPVHRSERPNHYTDAKLYQPTQTTSTPPSLTRSQHLTGTRYTGKYGTPLPSPTNPQVLQPHHKRPTPTPPLPSPSEIATDATATTTLQQPSINTYYHSIPTTHPKRNHGTTDPLTPSTSHQTTLDRFRIQPCPPHPYNHAAGIRKNKFSPPSGATVESVTDGVHT